MKKPFLSIVVPVFNEENVIDSFYSELKNTLDKLSETYEILFIDDGSSDGTFKKIEQLNSQDPNIYSVSFSRNFGHQIAIYAGLKYASGEVVISMDGDLQHPPEIIPLMLEKYRKGFDIVNTKRKKNKSAFSGKYFFSGLYYKIINLLSDVKIEPDSADFRLMNRKTINAFLEFNERDRFTRGLVSWMGFKQSVIEYIEPDRVAGKTKFGFVRMLQFALNGLTSFSSRPLRFSFYFGLLVFFLGIVYGIFAIVNFFMGINVPGWTSILLSVLFIGGIQLLSIGIVGEYIARIFNEAKGRPFFFIKDNTDNFSDKLGDDGE
jgi:dolichol-phosphate mannosyltransferase